MKHKGYSIFVLIWLIPIFAFSQIINKGTLQIKQTTKVAFVDTYTNDTGASHNNDGELYINHSFINHGSTSAISGTTYFKSII